MSLRTVLPDSILFLTLKEKINENCNWILFVLHGFHDSVVSNGSLE